MPLGPLLVFAALAGAALVLAARRFDDPAAASDPAALQAVEQNAAGLVAAFGAAVSASWTPPAAAGPWLELIAQTEQRYGIPQNLLVRQLDIESAHFNQDVVYGRRLSSAGAIGIAQFEPDTADELGGDPYDPVSSIDGAGRYMRALYHQFGSWAAALAAYNWGPGHVARQGADAAPVETQTYVAAILSAVGLTS